MFRSSPGHLNGGASGGDDDLARGADAPALAPGKPGPDDGTTGPPGPATPRPATLRTSTLPRKAVTSGLSPAITSSGGSCCWSYLANVGGPRVARGTQGDGGRKETKVGRSTASGSTEQKHEEEPQHYQSNQQGTRRQTWYYHQVGRRQSDVSDNYYCITRK